MDPKKKEPKVVLEGINRQFEEKNTLKEAEGKGLSYVNIGKTPINPDYLKLVSLEDSKEGEIISFFKVGDKLRVAVLNQDNPKTVQILEALKKEGYKLNVNLASKSGINEVLAKYENAQIYKEKQIVEKVEEGSIQAYEKEIAELKQLESKIPEITAEEAINLINIGAMKTKASDVHYEPEDKDVQIRMRIDGVLHQVFKIR